MTLRESNATRVAYLVGLLKDRDQLVASVESCSGGMVGAAITSIAGASEVYAGGYITYSNEMKTKCVGVTRESLERFGAVSKQVAIEMAAGGVQTAHVDYSLSLTGIAGPGGGSEEKPVGTVWICVAQRSLQYDCRRFIFPGARDAVRRATVCTGIEMLIQCIDSTHLQLAYEEERTNGYT